MDRIQLAAVAVAVALMALWFVTLPDSRSRPPAPAPAEESAQAPPRAGPAEAELPRPTEPAPAEVPPAPALVTQARTVHLENDAVRVEVSSAGGRIDSIELLRFRDRIGQPAFPVQLVTQPERGLLIGFLGGGPLEGIESAPLELVDSDPRRVTYRVVRSGVEVRRTMTLDDAGYGGQLRVSVINRGAETLRPRFELALYGGERDPGAPDRFQNYQLVSSVEGDLERMTVRGIDSPGFLPSLFGGGATPSGESLTAPVEWTGIESQYFLVAAIPENPRESSAYHGPSGPDSGVGVLRYPAFDVPAGRQVERVYRLYFGPKIPEHVADVDARLDPAVRVGWAWVRPLVDGFAVLLRWSYDHVVANYGVAIILLTVLLRLVTYPLTQRSMKSMKRFGEIAPLMKELQQKYKDDKQKLSDEMMSLYRKKGINPVSAMGGGCIPMLVQMPFMIALYFALQSSIELRHAPFVLWIQDLSAPEDLFSIAGLPVRPLPLLMGASMLLQQRLTPATGDPQQRQMMMWMSVVFTFLFYQFPSGLLLYWFVSNLLGIAQQVLVNRPPAEKKASD